MVALGKQSKYIHEMLGESDPVTNLDVLHTPTGPLFERKAIYEKLTHDFGKAYAGSQEHRTGIHKEGWDWTTGGTKANFLKRIKHHKIPPHLTNLIWEHMTNVPKAKLVHTDLQQLLDTPPSFDEFRRTITTKPSKSAGGLTETTYSMMKAWSPEFKRLVYDNLIPSWGTKQLPEWWKWRKLRLKLKDDKPITPQNLRPIVLVEVLRKIWIGLIILKINQVWQKHDILNSAQHGFRPKRGTDTALLQLQSHFEQSYITNSPLFLSSWDISKAFDSLSKNSLRFSWVRLGVPPEIADLLVSLDESGHTIIQTPYSQDQWNKREYNAFTHKKHYLDPRRGAGQGDVGSPLNWVAAFDILLCALSSVEEGCFYTLKHDDTLAPSEDIAYADDLVSGMSSITGLQLKADIVSAYAIIFGLDIATTKLRTFLHHPSGIIPKTPTYSINIHTTGWIEHKINISTTGTLKALGKLFDISSTDTHGTQFKETLRKTELSCSLIYRARGSTRNRTMVARSCVAKRVEYTGQFCTWNNHRLREIDRIFSKLYRKLSGNMPSFPKDLLYLPTNMGGLGYHMTSDGIHTAKFSILQRHLLADPTIKTNINTLLRNSYNNSSLQSPTDQQRLTIQPPPPSNHPPPFWADSISQFAATGLLSLTRSGHSYVNSPHTELLHHQPTTNWAKSQNIHTVADLYFHSPLTRTSLWHNFDGTMGTALIE